MGTIMIGSYDTSVQTDLEYIDVTCVPKIKEMQRIKCEFSLVVDVRKLEVNMHMANPPRVLGFCTSF